MRAKGLLADASTLIYLAKADVLVAASQIVGPFRVAPAVWREAIEVGLKRRLDDAMRLERAAQDGLLQRLDWSSSMGRRADLLAVRHRLGAGESQVLAVANRGEWVLMDDGRAASVAFGLGTLPVSTLFIPGMGLRMRTIRLHDAQRMLGRLASVVGVPADALASIEAGLSEDV